MKNITSFTNFKHKSLHRFKLELILFIKIRKFEIFLNFVQN